MVKVMRVYKYAALFFCSIALAYSVVPDIVQASASQSVVYKTAFIGLAPIPHTLLFPQTALRAGDVPIFQVNVHSPYAFSPIVSVDLSQFNISSPTTTPAGPGSPNYNSDSYYNFWPFVIDSGIPDGLKVIPITATDMAGGVATATAQIIVDNAPPIILLSSITFSTTSPRGGDYMYVSGRIDGTGSKARVSQIMMRLTDAAGKPVISTVLGGSTFNFDPVKFNAELVVSADGSFSNIPIQLIDLGDTGWIPRAANIGVDITAYDEAANFASGSLTVLVQKPAPPDPCATPGACASNVLFLPGIEGSRLYEGTSCGKTAEEKLWEPLGSSIIKILRGAGDDKVKNLFLDQSGESVCSDIYAKADDVIDSVGGNNIYKSFIDEMNELKSEGTINDWKPIAYDWRLSLDDLLNNGTEHDGKIFYEEATSTPYIEQTLRALAASSKTGKVTIVAHSNGGLVTKALLNKLGDTEATRMVNKIVLVSAPQSGAPVDVGALLYGYDQGISSYGVSILHSAVARELALNSPMAYHLIPSDDYMNSVASDSNHPVARFAGDAYAKEEAAYGSTIMSKTSLDDFLLAKEGGREKPKEDDVKSAEVLNANLVDYANSTHEALDAWVPPEGIEVDQIAGWGVDTVVGIDFYTPPKKSARLYRPIFTEDGDGTVSVPSALMMASSTSVKRYWVDLANSLIKHSNIFEQNDLRTFMKNILTNSTSSLPSTVSISAPTTSSSKKFTFFLHSPLTLQLTDSSGNITGLAEDGSIDQNIPDSTYGEFGEVKYVTVPQGSPYTLTLHGQESGSFSLDMQETSGGIITASSTVANVPTTSSTLASLTISGGIDTASALSVDENGDGKNTFTITPRVGETVNYEPLAPTPTSISTPTPTPTPTLTSVTVSEPVVKSSGGRRGSISAPVTASAAVETTTTPVLSVPSPRSPITPPRVFKKRPTLSSSASVASTMSNFSQTASVYNAASQQPALQKVGAVIYNNLHRIWLGLTRIFHLK